jgi:hypothetical protein
MLPYPVELLNSGGNKLEFPFAYGGMAEPTGTAVGLTLNDALGFKMTFELSSPALELGRAKAVTPLLRLSEPAAVSEGEGAAVVEVELALDEAEEATQIFFCVSQIGAVLGLFFDQHFISAR